MNPSGSLDGHLKARETKSMAAWIKGACHETRRQPERTFKEAQIFMSVAW